MTQDEIIDMARQVGIEAESDTLCRFGGWVEPFVAFAKLVAAKALAQTQEPVAWMHVQGNYKEPSFRELADDEVERGWEQYPLYNTPPQRTWVGLTDEDISEIVRGTHNTGSFVRAIEAKLKEKNT